MASTALEIVPNAVITTNVAAGEALARLLHEGDAVEAGHLQVRQDDVGRELVELAERLEPVGRRLGRVAVFAEDLGERGARVRLVVDDEDPAAGCHALPMSPSRSQYKFFQSLP